MTSLEECYAKDLLRRVEPSLAKARRSLEQSRVWAEEAQRALYADAYRSSQVSCYNAFFHAARAILYRDGVREKNHLCIELYLGAYAARGKLETTFVAQFSRMRSARHADLYSFSAAPSREEVESGVRNAHAFRSRMERLLEETAPGK